MLQEILNQYFGIQAQQSIKDGGYERYIRNGVLYTIVNVTNVEQEYLVELYQMAQHLSERGDKYVSSFVQAKEEKFLITHDEQDYVLLQNQQLQPPREKRLGRKLAKFHERGRTIPDKITYNSRIGEWKGLWEKRLDQMEKACYDMVQREPNDDFERMLIDAFPYYLGLAENGIQYLVDTELDDEPTSEDAGTVCHNRFLNNTWGTQYWVRFPFEWVFDHCSRDIADYIRGQYLSRNRTFGPDVQKFSQEYESVSKISSFGYRLTYARLVFPLHFFECVEEYFISGSEQRRNTLEEKLARYLKYSGDYERFLGSFYEIVGVSAKSQSLPRIQWLTK
ncbi:spore coat putative kinase YutH [Bacillus sp. 2205SS5-2]|uniref:spore coat putative kinase YutH n=1 Tax=Bacillus sp. 2205SS5-2 TaxID=3109031 RepID=UPI00300597E8